MNQQRLISDQTLQAYHQVVLHGSHLSCFQGTRTISANNPIRRLSLIETQGPQAYPWHIIGQRSSLTDVNNKTSIDF